MKRLPPAWNCRQSFAHKGGVVMSLKHLSLIVTLALSGTLALFADGPSFHPDATFKGSDLKGWHTLGQAAWRAENGELTGTPKDASGGWLVLDRSYQDIGLSLDFRCTGACQSGVLFRIQKTANGMKGVYVPLNDSDMTISSVTVDSEGRIVERSELRRGGGQMRIAPPPNPNAAPPRRPPDRPAGVNLPFELPDSSLRPNDWNQAELLFDANIVRKFLNGGRETGAVSDDDGYGPIALYAGGSGEAQFKSIAYRDLSLKDRRPEETSSRFRKQKVNDFYYSFAAAAGDFNHDGIEDIVSGPYIYYGPDYTKSREIYLAHTWDVSTQYAFDDWMEFAGDFTGDGWPDVMTCTFPNPGYPMGCYLYVNPKGENRRWDKFKVISEFQTEVAVLRDVDGDGKPELVYGGDGQVRYAKPDPANPTGPWIVHNVSEKGYETAHGIGVGDINGDGRMDIVNPYGWWEQPPPGSTQETWTYHPEVFGRFGRGIMGGSVIAVYDVNGDGLNDVVTVLNAHGWGLAWFEQKRDASGKISFVKHMVMDDLSTKNAGDVVFSEPHGTTFADVDGDGIPDFIVGKRYWAHRDDLLDPDPYGMPVLYWYKTVRDKSAPGGAKLVPELIDNRSGSGSDVLATDLNHDGAIDIVTATRFGTFIFWGKPHAGTGK
jgi:Domain of Unknown Function (DUF1080)/FG-GAP-like repeat